MNTFKDFIAGMITCFNEDMKKKQVSKIIKIIQGIIYNLSKKQKTKKN